MENTYITNAKENPLLSTQEVADILRVGYTKARDIIARNMTHYDLSNGQGVNRCIRVPVSEVERYLAQAAAEKPTPKPPRKSPKQQTPSGGYHFPRRPREENTKKGGKGNA